MSAKTQEDKFSVVEETTEEWYHEMERFIHYLAGANSGLAVDYDDIVQELAFELVKGVQHYPDLPHDQLKAVLRRMMDNRISELKYRYHVTHRKEALFDVSLSIEVSVRDFHKLNGLTTRQDDSDSAWPVEELISGGPDPAAVYASKEYVHSVRDQLSPIAKTVFDSLIYGNNMLAMLVWLSSIRASMVFGSRSVRVKPMHLADALHIREEDVRVALREIKKVCRSYND